LRPGVVMLPARGDGLLTTAEAARRIRVDPSTISQWRKRGHIHPDGLDERERPLYRPETVIAAELLVRQRGLETTGIDPRRLRKQSGGLIPSGLQRNIPA
jgi:MerR HTH family regulatory protein